MTPFGSTCRVLAIDGGGMRGVIPATILASMEKAVGGAVADRFHLIAGTSTGGILALSLAARVAGDKLVDFYAKDGPKIFSSSFYSGIEGPKYAPDSLEAVLKDVFKDGQLSDLGSDVLCTTYDTVARKGYLFESWRARGIGEPLPANHDYLVWQVARSTSAAPTYFPPTQAGAADGKIYSYIDGGMYANNPAMLAFVAARRLMPLAQRYLVVSLGTGENLKPIAYEDAKGWGIVGWGPKIIDVIFDAMGSTVEFELDQIDAVSQVRLQSSLAGASDALDDASPGNVAALGQCAHRTLAARALDWKALLSELRLPLPDRYALGYPRVSGAVRPPKVKDFSPAQIASEALGIGLPAVRGWPWALGGAVAGATAGGVMFGPVGAVAGGVLGAAAGSTIHKKEK